MFGQADRGLIDFVANVALVFSEVRTVLRMSLCVILQFGSGFAIFIAIRAMQADLQTVIT